MISPRSWQPTVATNRARDRPAPSCVRNLKRDALAKVPESLNCKHNIYEFESAAAIKLQQRAISTF
jgi:hypothetical protein